MYFERLVFFTFFYSFRICQKLQVKLAFIYASSMAAAKIQ